MTPKSKKKKPLLIASLASFNSILLCFVESFVECLCYLSDIALSWYHAACIKPSQAHALLYQYWRYTVVDLNRRLGSKWLEIEPVRF